MKVLVAHNRYQSDSPSGENQVVDAEIELLEKAGINVITQLESSDELKGASRRSMLEAGVGPLYAPRGVARFRHLLETERPDVVHLHNPIPLISPYVIRVANAAGIPVIQTVHNYRHSCVRGLHFRDGKSCVECVGRAFPTPAITHSCYRGSRIQSVPMATAQMLHRPTWKLVARFLALTTFMAKSLQATGIPADKITLRPSWVRDEGPTREAGNDILFVGRLDEAKGVQLLLDAWEIAGPASGRQLRIAGDGPLRSVVEESARRSSDLIRYEGWVDAPRVAELMSEAAVVLVPSLWFEGYPLVIAQAFARGRAVVTTDGGSPATIVDESVGWLADPTPASLAGVLRGITAGEVGLRGRAARNRYEAENSPTAALKSLVEIYQAVCGATG